MKEEIEKKNHFLFPTFPLLTFTFIFTFTFVMLFATLFAADLSDLSAGCSKIETD